MEFKPLCTSEIVFEDRMSFYSRMMDLPVHNVVLVMDESLAGILDLKEFTMDLQIRFAARWIKKVPGNPTQEDVHEALTALDGFEAELILAVGGGSAIDLAKGISAMYEYGKEPLSVEQITASVKNKTYRNKTKFLDIIAVPTTAGTGSEVTQWATIWDVSKTAKFSIDAPELKPKMALIVPEFTLSLPKRMILSTGLDAVAHAMEAFWAKHTTPLVGDLALQAVNLMTENLAPALKDPENLAVRERLCRGALLAGLAFSQTRTTACHSISYPMTFLYGVEHGFGAAMTLAAVAEINAPVTARMDEMLEIFVPHRGIQRWMDRVSEGIVSLRLSGFGIGEKDIPVLVEKAFTAGRMDNNPVDITPEQVEKILFELL